MIPAADSGRPSSGRCSQFLPFFLTFYGIVCIIQLFLSFRNNPQIPILKHKPARRKRRQRRRQKHRRHHRKWNHFFHLLFPHTRSPLSPNIRLISPCPIFSPNQTAKQLHSRFPSSTSILFYICDSANAGRTPYVSLSVLTGRRQPFTRSTP